MFPNIERAILQIMNHMKYIYTRNLDESSIYKVQSSYIECTLKETKQPIPRQHFFVELFNRIK
jgi:hypothetical protein